MSHGNIEGMFGGGGSRRGDNASLPDPFCDFATTVMPESKSDVLRLCEYIWLTSGLFKTAMQRIVRYFLTKVEFEGDISDREKKRYEEFFYDQLRIMDIASAVGDDFLCFHGGVKTTTRDGVFTLKELEGKTVEVLSEGGLYRTAEFKSFGKQSLLEVEFSDGRTILATPDHRWIVKNCADKLVELRTKDLIPGHKIPRTAAPRPDKDDDYYEGVRHGFTFGDGTLYNGGKQAVALFYGEKDKALLPYFEGVGCEPTHYDTYIRVNGLPPHYKQLPDNTSTASYWYGFISGFLAADGSVDKHGCALLTQKPKATLDIIADQLPRVGMVAGPVRGHRRVAEIKQKDGSVNTYDSVMHYVTLLKRFMQPEDFIIPKHRANFEEKYNETSYGEYIGIVEVRDTGIVDEVYCCVEMETHTFVVDNGILTKQCYGNSFSSVYMPFNRILICGQCGLSRALDKIKQFTFDSSSLEFKVVCPACKFDGKHEHKDLRSLDENRMHIIRWNPHEMEMLHNFITGETDFLWRVNRDIEGSIKKGRDFYLRTMPWEIIEAAAKKKLFRFSKDACYHIYEPTISGVQNRGWGIPRMLGTFKDIYYVQLLKRYNEVLALDYVVPFRIVTPQKSGVADPMMHHDGNMFKRNLTEMLQEHRRNPTGYHILPFPVQYQTLSGEGVQLSPWQLIKQGTSDMMDSIGVPVELFQGNMSMQAAPTALRLFQATWPQFSTAINGWLTWIAQKVSTSFGWEEVRCKLQPVTYADDIERKGMLINLAAAQQISKRTAFAFLDVDPKEERRRMMQEHKDDLDIQKEFEEDQLSQQEMSDMTAAGGQPPQQPQGMPPAGYGGADPMAVPPQQPMMGTGTPLGGGQPATTPEEVINQSQQVAQQLMSMDESTRKSQMIQLKRSNPLLHAQVKQIMQDMRQQAGQQGVAAMNQQMQQGGGQ